VSPVLDVYLDINGVLLGVVATKSIKLPVKFYPKSNTHQNTETLALIDSRAGGIFIDSTYQERLKLPTYPLDQPIIVHNVDGTRNSKGFITNYTELELDINGRQGTVITHITGLGKQNIILGFPWLLKWNPDIDWELGSLKWRDTGGGTDKTLAAEPKECKSRACELEGQEDARKNSGGKPKICCEPAIVALAVQNNCATDCVEGSSPNEEGGDDLESPVEEGYPPTIGQTLEEYYAIQVLEYDDKVYSWPEALETYTSPEDFETFIHHINLDKEYEEVWIQAKTNAAQIFAQRYGEHKGTGQTLEE
jgi:hypothetical protein